MTEVRLIQSGRFPNIWSIVAASEPAKCFGTWRDPLLANGGIAAESAVEFARNSGHEIVSFDGDAEVVAGIEYRSRRPLTDVWEAISTDGQPAHVIEVYPSGIASIIVQQRREGVVWTDECPVGDLVFTDEIRQAEVAVADHGTRFPSPDGNCGNGDRP